MSQDQFLDLVIKHQSIKQKPLELKFKLKTLWLKKEIQSKIISILDHKYPKLRLRYKISNDETTPTTIWYLEEIGKERPITFGISVRNKHVQVMRVLEFRESRGYEIHIPAFVKQFDQIGLDKHGKLDQNIDGITGATMSVSAMKKIARVALLLHKIVISNKDES